MENTATMIVIYDGVNQHTFSGVRDDRLTLAPGKNKVDVAQYNRLAGLTGKENGKEKVSSASLQLFIETKKVRPLMRDTGKGDVHDAVDDDVSKMTVAVASELIAETFTDEELDVYESQERAQSKPRKGVLDAIETQRDEIREPDADNGSADGNNDNT